MTAPTPQKLLLVVAHPDDECFAFGGALLLAAEAAVETAVLCLTDGQAASNRGTAASAEDLGRMRRAEFAASCAILGVSHCEVLDYHDGQLEHADFSLAAGRLVDHIRRIRPNVVLTFGGDGGMNTHPDHAMVSAFTTAAFHWAAQPKRFPAHGPVHTADRLYHVTTNWFLPERQPPIPAPWTVTLDVRAVQSRKAEAFAAHTSQAPLMERTRDLFVEHGTHEFYTLVATSTPQPATMTTSLFPRPALHATPSIPTI